MNGYKTDVSHEEVIMFSGTITALVTPFLAPKSGPALGKREAPIDFDALDSLIEWQLDCGVNGFVACGTTGETATLDFEEWCSVVSRVVASTKGRVPVIAGTGTNCTGKSIELAEQAKTLGADGLLVVAPYYNKPTQEGLYEHFKLIALSTELPIVLYNIPGRTSIEISVPTFARLAEFKNIVAVKEATGNAERWMDLRTALGDRYQLLAGDDSLTHLIMALGGTGVISAAANAIPRQMVAITQAAEKGELKASLAAQCEALPLIRALFSETNPGPAKAALAILGKLPTDTLRLPLVCVQPHTRELLQSLLSMLQ